MSPEELAWARESLAAGDPLAEIAHECGVDVLDIAQALGVLRAQPQERRWRQSWRRGGREAGPFVGALLKEVAAARYRAGERISDLAREAGVSPRWMAQAVKS